MSKRTSSIDSVLASCLASSVLPTPVGPENKYDPIGFSISLKPARDDFIDDDNNSTA